MTRPGITASTLCLPCVSPASCPASCVLVLSLLRSPAFSCVLLRHLASASCILCGFVVSRTFHWFPDRNESILLPVSIFPCVPIIRSPFHDPLDPSILPPVPCVQFRGDFVSGLSKSSSPFLPPFSASLCVRFSIIPLSSLLPSAVSAVVSQSSPPFVTLKAVVCFSFPPLSPNCSYRVPSSRRTRFRIYKSVLVTLNKKTKFSLILSSALRSRSRLRKIGRSLPSSLCPLCFALALAVVLRLSCGYLRRLLSQSSPICFVLRVVLP